MGVEVTFDLLGLLYNQVIFLSIYTLSIKVMLNLLFVYIMSQLQSCHAQDIKEDYDTGKDGTAMVSFKVEFDQVDKLEDAIKSNCRRDLVFFKN